MAERKPPCIRCGNTFTRAGPKDKSRVCLACKKNCGSCGQPFAPRNATTIVCGKCKQRERIETEDAPTEDLEALTGDADRESWGFEPAWVIKEREEARKMQRRRYMRR